MDWTLFVGLNMTKMCEIVKTELSYWRLPPSSILRGGGLYSEHHTRTPFLNNNGVLAVAQTHDPHLAQSDIRHWDPVMHNSHRSTRRDLRKKFCRVVSGAVNWRRCWSGAWFTKYLMTILRLSYDNVKVTIDLRRTSNRQKIFRRA